MSVSREDLFVDAFRVWVEALTHRSMVGLAAHAKENGLSMAQLAALVHVRKLGSCAVTDLSDDLGVTSAAVSQMVDRLVQGGLVLREEDPDDRRARRIELTRKGYEVMTSTMEVRRQWFAAIARTLTPDQLDMATETMRLLADRVSAITEENR